MWSRKYRDSRYSGNVWLWQAPGDCNGMGSRKGGVMRRTTARDLLGLERFPVDAGVAELSEEWAAMALEALRVAAVNLNGRDGGGERGAGAGRSAVRRCPRLEL